MASSSMSNEDQRRRSPPPSYEEAIDDRPPPIYTESAADQESVVIPQTRSPSQRTAIVYPENIVASQPGRQPDRLTRRAENGNTCEASERHRRLFGCNCLCSAIQWTPWTCDYELFCFNCLGFFSYLLLCAPWVYLCFGCKKLCPDTCDECCTRNTSLMESYEDKDEHIASQVCWFCFGPCCCFTCDGDTEVLPCSDPCVKHCGVCTVLKKMTCYCGSYKLCDYTLNAMDEQAFGFICDCKEVGCHFKPGASKITLC